MRRRVALYEIFYKVVYHCRVRTLHMRAGKKDLQNLDEWVDD